MVRETSEIRILPMSKEEQEFKGKTLQEVQSQFFLKDLPIPPRDGRKAGEYRYLERSLIADRGTVVLFQYENSIVASATLEKVERFKAPKGPYTGALYFDPKSIRVFDPVGPEVLREVWPKFSGFNQSKQFLDGSHLPLFEGRLTNIRTPNGL